MVSIVNSFHRPGCGCAVCRPTGGHICKACIHFAPGQYRIGKCQHPNVAPEGSPRHETESCGSFTGGGELFKPVAPQADPRIATIAALCGAITKADTPWSADSIRFAKLEGERRLAQCILEILK